MDGDPARDRPPRDRPAATRRGLLAAAAAALGAGALGRGVGVAAADHDEVLLADGFERSTTGGPPRNWTGTRTGTVVGSRTAPEGEHVLRMGSRADRCRTALAARDVGRLPRVGVVAVSGFVRPSAGPRACRAHRAAVRLGRGRAEGAGGDGFPGGTGGDGRLLVGFHEDGSVVGPGNSRHGTYRLDDWNAFTVTYGRERGGARLGYTVNGDWRGTLSTGLPDRGWEEVHLRLAASGTVTWDGISVVHRRTRGVRAPAPTQLRALSAYREAVAALRWPWDPGRSHVSGPAATAVREALLDLFGPGMPDFAFPAGTAGQSDLVERTESAFRVLGESDVRAAREAVRGRWHAGETGATRRSYVALGVDRREAAGHPFAPLFGVLEADLERVVERGTPDARARLADHAANVDAVLGAALPRLRDGSYPPGGDELVVVLAVLSGVARTLRTMTTV